MNKDEKKREVAEIDQRIAELKSRRKELLAELGEGRLSWGAIVAGAFGAVMIGLGVIALFAANWDEFGREARAAIAVAPVVACGCVAAIAFAKEWRARSLWEPLGLLWCVSVIAATCLVAQTYNVGGSASGLVLFTALLMLPAIWLTRAATPTVLWPISVVVWCASCKDEGVSASVAFAAKSLAFMALSLPAYIAYLRNHRGKTSFPHITAGLVYSIGLGTISCAVLPDEFVRESNAIYIFWACAAIVGICGRSSSIPAWGTVSVVVASFTAFPCVFFNETPLFAAAIAIAVGTVTYGISRLRGALANIGGVTLAWLIVGKFFASDLPFTAKGIVLIGAGLALTLLNVCLVRIRRRRA